MLLVLVLQPTQYFTCTLSHPDRGSWGGKSTSNNIQSSACLMRTPTRWPCGPLDQQLGTVQEPGKCLPSPHSFVFFDGLGGRVGGFVHNVGQSVAAQLTNSPHNPERESRRWSSHGLGRGGITSLLGRGGRNNECCRFGRSCRDNQSGRDDRSRRGVASLISRGERDGSRGGRDGRRGRRGRRLQGRGRSRGRSRGGLAGHALAVPLVRVNALVARHAARRARVSGAAALPPSANLAGGARGGGRGARCLGRDLGGRGRGAGDALAVPLVEVDALGARHAGRRARVAQTTALAPDGDLGGGAGDEDAGKDRGLHVDRGSRSKLLFGLGWREQNREPLYGCPRLYTLPLSSSS